MKNFNRFITATVFAGLIITGCLTDKGGDNTPPGIPTVAGLRATYDTTRGVVHLTWDSVNYADFSQYLVYRDRANTLPLSQQPVGFVSTAAFDDTLLSPARAPIFYSGDTSDRSLEYRIKVRNNADVIGLNNGFLPILAVAPARAMTSISFRLPPQVAWDSANQVDSTALAVDLRNSLRGLTEITWALGRSDSIVATRSLSGNSLTDSLRFGWAKLGPYTVYVRVRDAAGLYWTDSLRIQGNSAPVIGGSPATNVKNGREFLFTPTASDPDFDALSFSAPNRPIWMSLDPVTGQLRGTPSGSQIGAYPGIALRVSDGKRITALTFNLAVMVDPWTLKRPADTTTYGKFFGAASLGGRIHVTIRNPFSGTGSVYSYDPSTDTWSNRGADALRSNALLTVNGEILSFTNDSVLAYDTAAQTWEVRDSLHFNSGFYASLGGKAYLINDTSVTEYDPTLNIWNPKQFPPFQFRGLYPTSIAVSGNNIYVIGRLSDWSPSGLVLVYDPALDTWSDGPQIPIPISEQSLCAGNGKIYVMGGRTPSLSSRVDEFDPTTGTWALKSPAHSWGHFGPCSEYGGKIYVFGYTGSADSDLHPPEEYDPSVDN